MDTITQEEADILSCSICLEIMKEPKVLPCLHRLCESCLNKHITALTSKDAGVALGFSCPDCRQFIPAPDTKGSPSTWAAQFKTDFVIKRLTELSASRQELHNNKQHINHPCPEHTNTEVDLYCVDCSKAVCHLCATTTHEKCDRLVTVKKAAQGHKSKLQQKFSGIQPIIKNALKRKTVRERCMREVYDEILLVDKDISEFTRKVQERVDEQKHLLLKELYNHYEILHKNVSANACKLTDHVNQLQDLVKMGMLKVTNTSDLDLLLDSSFNSDIDSYSKQAADVYQQYDSLCKKISAVKCRFEASKTACVSLGNIVFLSDISDGKGSNEQTPSGSQSCNVTPGHSLSPRGLTASMLKRVHSSTNETQNENAPFPIVSHVRPFHGNLEESNDIVRKKKKKVKYVTHSF